MYCTKCNADFPDDVRYCKWCGERLYTRARATTKLSQCPHCSDPVQDSWVFCKSCGKRLIVTAPQLDQICQHCGTLVESGDVYCSNCGKSIRIDSGELGKAPPVETSAPLPDLTHCPVCGEEIVSNTGYCKSCGSSLRRPQLALEPEPARFIICPHCESENPADVTICRTCGTPIDPKTAREYGDRCAMPTVASPPSNALDYATMVDAQAYVPGSDSLTGSSLRQSGQIGATEPNPGAPADTSQPPSQPLADGSNQTPGANQPSGGSTALPTGPSKPLTPGSHPLAVGYSIESESPPSPPEAPQPRPSAEVAGPGSGALETTSPPGGDTLLPPTGDVAAPPSGPDWLVALPLHEDAGSEAGSPQPPTGSIQGGSGLSGMSIPGDNVPFVGMDDDTKVLDQSRLASANQMAPTPVIPSEESGQPQIEPNNQPVAGAPTPVPSAPGPTAGAPGPPATPNNIQATGSIPPAQPTAYPPRPNPVAQKPVPTARAAWEAKSPQPAKKGSKAAKIILALAAIFIVFVAAAAFVVWRFYGEQFSGLFAKTQPSPIVALPSPSPLVTEPSPVPTASPAGLAPAVPEGMVEVPAGSYTIGCEEGDQYAKPSHSVNLPAFYIDRTEVTNEDYKKFVDATGHKPPDAWETGSFPDGKEKFPVTGVTWQDASDYAKWAGKRLPSESEWEAAARGSDAQTYPWGNEWRKGLSNTGTKATVEVGSYPAGASPCGALDMIGNVWEWTADEFALYPGAIVPLPDGLEPGVTYRVIRGGAFDAVKPSACYRGFVDGSKSFPKTGFRCAKGTGATP